MGRMPIYPGPELSGGRLGGDHLMDLSCLDRPPLLKALTCSPSRPALLSALLHLSAPVPTPLSVLQAGIETETIRRALKELTAPKPEEDEDESAGDH
eukprot:scaffold567_cov127-Isochrysis_galbana.AAC.4